MKRNILPSVSLQVWQCLKQVKKTRPIQSPSVERHLQTKQKTKVVKDNWVRCEASVCSIQKLYATSIDLNHHALWPVSPLSEQDELLDIMPVKQRVSGEQNIPQTFQSRSGSPHFLHKQQGLYNTTIKRHPESYLRF